MLLGLSIGYFLSFNYRINRLLRASILIPWLLPAVVSVAAWRWMYSAEEGVINDILKRAGLIERGIPWLGDPSLVIYALIVVAVWRLLPFGALVISAAVQGILNSYLEAATIDGANGWQKFRYIVRRADVPIDRHRHPGADLEYERSDHRVGLDQGGPADASQILSTWIYSVGFNSFRFGLSSALSVINFSLLLLASIAYLLVLRRTGE